MLVFVLLFCLFVLELEGHTGLCPLCYGSFALKGHIIIMVDGCQIITMLCFGYCVAIMCGLVQTRSEDKLKDISTGIIKVMLS